MGEERVNVPSEASRTAFTQHLLRDVQALDYMLKHDLFETATIRIGAEQEMCLVDKKTLKPAPKNMNVLRKLKEFPFATTEIARFNLETNFTPQVFTGNALRLMETENMAQLEVVRKAAHKSNTEIVLTGVLPTLRKFDLALENLTPKPRYLALIEAINAQVDADRGFELRLQGIDELHIRHDSPLMEACNTSYQVHLQVTPDTFVPLYNIAQAIAAPILAIAANSPLVFGKRLWHESRIALFQQSLDVRTSKDHMRQSEPRVSFGTRWLENSIMEIYKEDIARFRVLLGSQIDEDSLEMLSHQKIPKLRALQVHNGTVYRWNRPCYGISDNGQPHLRIENRVLPAGPTVLDQTANAAFWLGTMIGMAHEYKDVSQHMSFDDAKDNFTKAAKFGIDTQLTWFGNEKISCCELILKHLLPIARKGLRIPGHRPGGYRPVPRRHPGKGRSPPEWRALAVEVVHPAFEGSKQGRSPDHSDLPDDQAPADGKTGTHLANSDGERFEILPARRFAGGGIHGNRPLHRAGHRPAGTRSRPDGLAQTPLRSRRGRKRPSERTGDHPETTALLHPPRAEWTTPCPTTLPSAT